MLTRNLRPTFFYQHNFIAKLSSVKFSASQVELRLALLSLTNGPQKPIQKPKFKYTPARLPEMWWLAMINVGHISTSSSRI